MQVYGIMNPETLLQKEVKLLLASSFAPQLPHLYGKWVRPDDLRRPLHDSGITWQVLFLKSKSRALASLVQQRQGPGPSLLLIFVVNLIISEGSSQSQHMLWQKSLT